LTKVKSATDPTGTTDADDRALVVGDQDRDHAQTREDGDRLEWMARLRWVVLGAHHRQGGPSHHQDGSRRRQDGDRHHHHQVGTQDMMMGAIRVIVGMMMVLQDGVRPLGLQDGVRPQVIHRGAIHPQDILLQATLRQEKETIVGRRHRRLGLLAKMMKEVHLLVHLLLAILMDQGLKASVLRDSMEKVLKDSMDIPHLRGLTDIPDHTHHVKRKHFKMQWLNS